MYSISEMHKRDKITLSLQDVISINTKDMPIRVDLFRSPDEGRWFAENSVEQDLSLYIICSSALHSRLLGIELVISISRRHCIDERTPIYGVRRW